MALGRPAISEGSARDLRSTIAVLGAIRARIQAIESSLGTVSDTATASSSANSTQLNALRQQLQALQSKVDQILATLGNANDDVVYTAAETINLGQGAVVLSETTAGAADPSDTLRIFTVIGVALNPANAGQSVTVRRRGVFTLPGASFAPNRAVYASATGLTQTPDYEVTALPIGVALTATQIYVEPDWPALQTPIFSSSGTEEIYERYMPVTYRLLQDLDVDASHVIVNHLSDSVWRTQEDFNNVMLSPGIITGGMLSDAGSGNIHVQAGTAILRIADDNVSNLVFVNFPLTTLAVPNDSTIRFVGLVYNSGNPQVVLRTSQNWDNDTEIAMGSTAQNLGTIFVFNNPFLVGDPITNIIQRFDSFAAANRDVEVGGLTIGETGTRNITMTAGRVWARLNDFAAAALNTSVSGSVISAYYNGTNWVFTPGVTQWPNTQYNDITSGLAAMTVGRYVNLWFYITIETGVIVFQYGQAQYTSLALAAAESEPTFRPPNAEKISLLLGRFIFKKNDATTSQIDQAYNTTFSLTAVSDHNNLGGLQGGTAGEYFHLTSAQYAALGSAPFTRGASWAGPSNGAVALPIPDIPVFCPVGGTITRVTVLTRGGTGSCVIDIWKIAYGSYPPTVSNSITASAKPTISSGIKYQDAVLTGWTKTITAGDTLMFNLTSTSTFTFITIILEITP